MSHNVHCDGNECDVYRPELIAGWSRLLVLEQPERSDSFVERELHYCPVHTRRILTMPPIDMRAKETFLDLDEPCID